MKLVYITNRYPFSYGEPFLDTERKYMPGVEEVYFLPWETFDYTETRNEKVYENAFKMKSLISDNWFIKFMKSIKDMLNPAFIMEVKTLIIEKNFSLYRVRQILFFMRNKKKCIKEMCEFLKQRGVKKDEKILFYSYWLNHTAYIANEISKKYKNAKVISRAHRYDLYQEENGGYIPFQKRNVEKLHKIYCIAEDGQKYLLSKYPAFKDKIKISKLGTEDYGKAQYKSRSILRIVSCSYVVPVKRIYLIVEILSRIKDVQIDWTHIGDGVELEKIKKICEIKLPENVKVNFEGNLTNKEVIEKYKSEEYHLFINVSESEGIPVSIMEAISFGIPVMATDVGGTKEIVNKHTGKLLEKSFDIQNAVEFIEKIAHMKEQQYIELRNSARSFWKNNYFAENNYKNFYSELFKENI